MSETMLAQHMRRADIFSDLTNEQLVKIALHAHRKVFDKGDTIAQKGAYSDHTAIIVDGSFECTDGIGKGKSFTDCQTGTAIGEMAMFIDDFEHISTFVATSRVKALLIDRNVMLKLMEEDRELAERFIDKVAGRLSEVSSVVSGIEKLLQDYGMEPARAAA